MTGKDVEKILDWENTAPKQVEIPFKPARVLLQVRLLSLISILIFLEVFRSYIVLYIYHQEILIVLLPCGYLSKVANFSLWE